MLNDEVIIGIVREVVEVVLDVVVEVDLNVLSVENEALKDRMAAVTDGVITAVIVLSVIVKLNQELAMKVI